MRAASIDIGSNSIKLLVAERTGGGPLLEVASEAIEARISRGIGSGAPKLSEAGMERGIAAASSMAGKARSAGAVQVSVVATSAVRDASNGAEFARRIQEATGLALRILSGDEEAGLIAKGILTDPSLDGAEFLKAFDLGGGSLECLSFHNAAVEAAVSLPLGCVRLTEMFVPDPSAPFGERSAKDIAVRVREALRASGFPLPVPSRFSVVGTGGTLSAARAMEAARLGTSFGATSPVITADTLRRLLDTAGRLPLAERAALPGLPPERADVFPAALVTLLALCSEGGIRAFHHSLRNLRWGVAAEILA
ncbi:MAG TPA: phosphatase [Opitutaceae bacterium]|jgi:exopolyphosphatase/guanosine-5'-triphosphate,3'-diphosphate pyrophosphatase